MWFGVEKDDPSLLTAVARAVCLDPVPRPGDDEHVTIRLEIVDDTSIELTATYAIGSPEGTGVIDDETGLPNRYGGTRAALGLAARWACELEDRRYRLSLAFDPDAFASGAALSRDLQRYTTISAEETWYDAGPVALTVEDRRPAP